VRARVFPVLTLALVAIVTAACGGELTAPEELFAVPVQREASPTPADLGFPAPSVEHEVPPEVLEPGARDGGGDDPAGTEPSSPPAVQAEGATEPEAQTAPAEPPVPAPGDEAPRETPAAGGPSDADVARFVQARAASAVSSDHHAADVTGDGTRDVVVGLRDVDGTLTLVLGTWDGEAFVEAGRVHWPHSSGLGALTVRDLSGDGNLEVLLPYRDRPRSGVLVATVSSAGVLEAPPGCPLPGASSQVLDFGDGKEAVELACRPNEARGKDRLLWGDGVFAGATGTAAKDSKDSKDGTAAKDTTAATAAKDAKDAKGGNDAKGGEDAKGKPRGRG
jgi:hypothetical protein